MKVRFAVTVGTGGPNPQQLAHVVTEAEERGFDTVWLSDVPSLPSTDPSLAVSFAAGITSKLHLGVNLIPFGTAPYLVAHRLAQLDRLTSGRLLVTLVPGLELATERQALGTAGRHRGRMMDAVIPQLRAWWAGEAVDVGGVGVVLPERPVQEPLELWLGGSGPEAIDRAGRLSDGWLGSFVSPVRAGRIRQGIQDAAAEAGRVVDPEHFGLSIAHARSVEEVERAARTRPLSVRRPGGEGEPDPAELIPVGTDALRRLVGQLVDQGLSKFVVRPVVAPEDDAGWSEELAFLADALLDLQT